MSRVCTSSEAKCAHECYCMKRLMVHVWNQPPEKLLEPSSRWVADRSSLFNSWLCSCSTVDTSEAQSSTLLQPPFIMDSVSPEREQSEPYDTPWPAGNWEIIKWHTSMSRVPYKSMSPCAEYAGSLRMLLLFKVCANWTWLPLWMMSSSVCTQHCSLRYKESLIYLHKQLCSALCTASYRLQHLPSQIIHHSIIH